MLLRVMLSVALLLAGLVSPASAATQPNKDGNIAGRVLDAKRAPAAGIHVILGELGRSLLIYITPAEMFPTTPGIFDPESKRYKAELTTDADGRFHASGLAPGEFSIVAAHAERGIAFSTVRVEADGTADVEIVLAPPAFVEAEIAGLPFDPQHDTLELSPFSQGSNIQLVPRLSRREGQWSFESAPLPAIRGWRVVGSEVVLEQDYRATLFALPVSAAAGERARIAIDLTRGSEISGRVLGAHGEPLSGVSVVARASGEPPPERGAVTDAQGRYRLRGLADGKQAIEVARWRLRELPGCGNGAQDVHATAVATLPLEKPGEIDFRIESMIRAPSIGDPVPAFTARTLDGRTVDISALRGKVVLIDFWATWCGMCRVAMPSLLATYEELARDGRFEIIGVSVDTDLELVPRFVSSRGLRWIQTALGGAATNPIARLFNVNSTPSTVLVDREGRIAALNLADEALRKKVEELLRAR